MKNLIGMTIAILVADGFEQVELEKPKQALEQAGAVTHIISPNKSKVQGWNHDQKADEFRVDVTLSKADPKNYDALLLPGGVMNPDILRMNDQAVVFVKAFVDAKKPIAAICHGPWTLINAGGVKGYKVTSWPSLKMDLINAGANWVDQAVVKDRNLVTSRKPADIPVFNTQMIKLFSSK